MMDSFYNEVMDARGEGERLRRLPEAGKKLFAAACADRVFWRHYPLFAGRVSPDELAVVRSALEQVWAGAEPAAAAGPTPDAAREMVQRVGAMIVDAEDDDPYWDLPEWNCTLLAAVRALRCIAGDDLATNVEYAGSDAYQAAAARALIDYFRRTGSRSLGGEAIGAMESESPACRAEIAFQLDCIRRIEAGQPLSRHRPAGE